MTKKRKRKAPQLNAMPLPPSKPPWFDRLSWQIGGLGVLVLLAYANSLHGQWVYDDYYMQREPHVVGPGFGWGIFRMMQTRPLTFLSFHWNYLASGQDPVSWHVVNTLLHAANAILLLLVARRHLAPATAFIAASAFAVHPLQTEAVAYTYQRASLLAAFFALLSLLLFLDKQWAWSVAAFALSLLAKEETIALPALLFLYDVVWKRRRPRIGYYAAMLGVAALATVRLFYVLRLSAVRTVGYSVKAISAVPYALTQSRVIWNYLRLFVFPVGQNVDHDVVVSNGLFTPFTTLPALLALAALVGLLGWLAWRGHQAAFWGLGFFILLAPSSSVVPVQDLMFEHRVYFPSMCLVIAAALLLVRLPRGALPPAVGVILITLLALTVARNRVWHDEKSLWTDAAEKSPHKARPYGTLGRLWMSEDPQRARRYLEQAFALKPDDPSIQTGLGLADLFTKDGSHALEHFRRAIALGGATPDNLTNLAMAYHLLGQLDQAVDNYHRALEIDGCWEKARRNLALALAMEGKKTEATSASQLPPECGQGKSVANRE